MIRDMLVRIRIRTIQLLIWIRILLFSPVAFKMATKNKFCYLSFFAYYSLKVHLHQSSLQR